MKERWMKVLCIALMVPFLCTGIVSAQGVERLEIPFSWEVGWIQCGDGPFLLTGTGVFTYNIGDCTSRQQDKTWVQFRAKGEAVSLATGQRYLLSISNMDLTTYECAPDGGTGPRFAFTFVDVIRLISQGPQPNVLATTRLHITHNANGEPTAQIEFYDCKVVGREQ